MMMMEEEEEEDRETLSTTLFSQLGACEAPWIGCCQQAYFHPNPPAHWRQILGSVPNKRRGREKSLTSRRNGSRADTFLLKSKSRNRPCECKALEMISDDSHNQQINLTPSLGATMDQL